MAATVGDLHTSRSTRGMSFDPHPRSQQNTSSSRYPDRGWNETNAGRQRLSRILAKRDASKSSIHPPRTLLADRPNVTTEMKTESNHVLALIGRSTQHQPICGTAVTKFISPSSQPLPTQSSKYRRMYPIYRHSPPIALIKENPKNEKETSYPGSRSYQV
jgi:hypothetical protein